jgi:diadenosine tetraphosphate (Ap4A) HIT family hydrolase
VTTDGCPICAAGKPRGVLAERQSTWITSEARTPTFGYVCVVAKPHVVEPFELDGEDRALFWEDVLFAAERLAELVRPRKINYEIHGNTVPHLHAHVFARFEGDRFTGGPIDPRRKPVDNVSLADLRGALR